MIIPSYIPSPANNGFYIGPLFVHAYGVAYVFAVAAAIVVTRWRWRKVGGDPDLAYEAAAWGFPAGLIGGRIYFLITTPSQIEPHNFWGIFAIWNGGLGIWGGILGGVLGGLYIVRKRLTHADVLRFMDAVAPALLVAQSVGRIGNYFNQELFGKPSTLPWALKIAPAHRPPHYTQFATFQPTFLYEIIWNLSLAGFLIWLGNHRKIKPPGLMALYVAGYSGFRIFEETIRIDYSTHIVGMRLNFWIATLVCLAGLGWFARIQKRGKYEPLPLDGPSADARAVRRRKPTAPYRKPPAPAYGKKSASGAGKNSAASGAGKKSASGEKSGSGARPASRSAGSRRGDGP